MTMARIFVEVSLSLDGMIAGPGVTRRTPMGRGGERLHAWQDGDAVDRAAALAVFTGTGAFVVGRRTYDAALDAWGEDGAFGGPVVVVTNRPQAPVTRGRTVFTFTTGIGPALDRARVAAQGGAVCVVGGADVARQVLDAGLADELRIHIAPVVLGAGTPLFSGQERPLALTPMSATATPLATHLAWRIGPGAAP